MSTASSPSRTWLAPAARRAAEDRAWETTHGDVVRPPKGTTHVVLDTPAGLHGKRLDEVMKLADKVLIPLQPSIFDIHATHDFINQLLDHRRSPSVQIAVVGTRTREGTISTDQLRSFLESVSRAVAGVSARHAELRPPRRPRVDAVGRLLECVSSATASNGSRSWSG